MQKFLDIIIWNSLDISKCGKALDTVKRYKNAVHLMCGLGECFEHLSIFEKAFGIPIVYDDDHVIKELKRTGSFISGTWVEVDNVCFAGIDAKNPVQSINKIVSSDTKRRCSLSIILSAYPLAISRCAKTVFMGREYLVGISAEFSRKILERIPGLKLIISCTEYSSELCIDQINETTSHISIPRNVNILMLRLDIDSGKIIFINMLE